MIAICALNFEPSHHYEPDMGFGIFQFPLLGQMPNQYKLISGYYKRKREGKQMILTSKKLAGNSLKVSRTKKYESMAM
jgi:hypothetical protein